MAIYNHTGHPGCDGSLRLTLADRELIRGASCRQFNDDGTEFCTVCLADLPTGVDALSHLCDEPQPPAAVQHKTQTTQPTGYVYDSYGARRSEKRGRLMYDKSSFALCTCGWVAAGATRDEARSRARAHREAEALAAETFASIAAQNPELQPF